MLSDDARPSVIQLRSGPSRRRQIACKEVIDRAGGQFDCGLHQPRSVLSECRKPGSTERDRKKTLIARLS